ncbi:D-hexose-6-phosphate mutarotase [Pseudomonas sp. Leaf129]|uniref:D-hexose-6-phosphate mutarotase n=1 Tax=Pseudomonas sp. Leaf129 TaxID=1736268 RepID=UPI000702B972|nr:D-hexose-6-phosphate mutarotase [Pseudomonas sp. Leaf129]KQQ57976.1 D-hexose-6-phosphate mutarotase [Pseudomonas sp. Leaf129]
MSEPQVESVKLDELNCWRISTDQAELLIAQQGAQVISYQRHGQQPLIWPNPAAFYKSGKAVRTGVPVCWPWFGNLARNPESVQAMRTATDEAPAHGLVRTVDWELLGIDRLESGIKVELSVPQAARGELPGWPHKVEVKLCVVLGETLEITLHSRNLDDHPVILSQALHSYFAVSDVRQATVECLGGLTYIETLDDWQPRQQAGVLGFAGETDRIYLNTPAQLSFVDPGWQRRVTLASTGSRSAVVWNPWTARAAALPDMADDGWQGMLCIETANVWDDVATLAPGAACVMGVRFTASQL